MNNYNQESEYVLYKPDLNDFNSVIFAPIINYSRLSYTSFAGKLMSNNLVSIKLNYFDILSLS